MEEGMVADRDVHVTRRTVDIGVEQCNPFHTRGIRGRAKCAAARVLENVGSRLIAPNAFQLDLRSDAMLAFDSQ